MANGEDEKAKFLRMLRGIDLDTYNFSGSHAYGGSDDVLNKEILNYILEDIKQHPEIVDEAINVGSYYKKRVDRSESSIQRTYCVMHDNTSGELSLIIEPKSKNIFGGKLKSLNELPKGADKVLKIAYKVGANELEQTAGLVVKFEQTGNENVIDKKKRIEAELEVNNKFNHVPGFCSTLGTRDRVGGRGVEKRTIYAPYQKDGTLEDLLETGKALTDNQKIEIARQILQIIVELSNKEVSHHDIKPSNFLVKFDGDNPIISVTDFGYSLGFGDAETGKFTPKYANPFVLSKIFDHSIVKSFLDNVLIANPLKENPISRYTSYADKLASSAHDVYATGVILFEMLKGKNYDGKDYDNLKREDGLELLLKRMLGAGSLKEKPEELLAAFNIVYPKPSNKPTMKI